MTRLVRNLYRDGGDLLDLHHRQMRTRAFIHNAHWHSGSTNTCHDVGAWLGCGDLSLDDILNIVAGLEPGEVFVILEEDEGTGGDIADINYLAERARLIIVKDTIYGVRVPGALANVMVGVTYGDLHELLTRDPSKVNDPLPA
jgi:hypothetical protein